MLWISLKFAVIVSQTIIVGTLTIFKVLQLKPQNIHCVEYSCELFDPPGNDIYRFKILKLLLIICIRLTSVCVDAECCRRQQEQWSYQYGYQCRLMTTDVYTSSRAKT